MALPVEFNTVTLYGKYIELDGDPVVGYLTFKPSPVILKAGISHAIIVPVVLEAELDSDGYFEINLPATDDPDINPADWTYEVTEGFGPRRVYNIEVHLAEGPTVNIFDKVPVPAGGGTTSLVGPTGPAGPPALITAGKPANTVGSANTYALDPATGLLYYRQTTTWDNGVQLAATAVAAHAALTGTHGVSTVVGTTEVQVLSNKTLTAPVVTGGLDVTGTVTLHNNLSVTGDLSIGGNVTLTGDLAVDDITADVGAFAKLTVTANPLAATDVANKGYVDNAATGTAASTPNQLVKRDASASFSAAYVTLDNDPTATGHAARKGYVDSTVAANLVTAKAYTDTTDTARKTYVDSAFATPPTGRKTIVYLGSGTIFPTTGLLAGDIFRRTDLYCAMRYSAGTTWLQAEAAIGTSTQRTGIITSALHIGFLFSETDTNLSYRWDGASWQPNRKTFVQTADPGACPDGSLWFKI